LTFTPLSLSAGAVVLSLVGLIVFQRFAVYVLELGYTMILLSNFSVLPRIILQAFLNKFPTK